MGNNGDPVDVCWVEQRTADAPPQNFWLSERELRFLEPLRFAQRRADWRLGRWTAKQAVSIWLGSPQFHLDLAKIEIRSAASGAPQVFVEDDPADVTISLSHRNGRALCALTQAGVDLGCDLELIEPHSRAFVADYFTAEEQALVDRQVGADCDTAVALLWSAKESALKALHEGLRLDTRSVAVQPLDAAFDTRGWRPLKVIRNNGQIFHGWWQTEDTMVRVIVASTLLASPTRLVPGDFHGCATAFPGPGSVPAEKRGNAFSIGT